MPGKKVDHARMTFSNFSKLPDKIAPTPRQQEQQNVPPLPLTQRIVETQKQLQKQQKVEVLEEEKKPVSLMRTIEINETMLSNKNAFEAG